MFFDPMSNFMFSIFPMINIVIFAIVIIAFIVIAIKGIKTWSYNNSQPVLTVYAKIIAKRMDVRSNMISNDTVGHIHHNTMYFITFEVDSGDRLEFHVDDREYAMLAEGDSGKLTFQGTRYLGFKRNVKAD